MLRDIEIMEGVKASYDEFIGGYVFEVTMDENDTEIRLICSDDKEVSAESNEFLKFYADHDDWIRKWSEVVFGRLSELVRRTGSREKLRRLGSVYFTVRRIVINADLVFSVFIGDRYDEAGKFEYHVVGKLDGDKWGLYSSNGTCMD